MYSLLLPGDIVMVHGPAGVGRTGYALSLVRDAVAAEDRHVLFLDAEGMVDGRWDDAWSPMVTLANPLTMEQADRVVREAVLKGVDMVILDGVARLPSSHPTRMGNAASILMNLLNWLHHRVALRPVVVFTTQSSPRSKPGVHSRGVEYMATVQVELQRGQMTNTVDVVMTRSISGFELPSPNQKDDG